MHLYGHIPSEIWSYKNALFKVSSQVYQKSAKKCHFPPISSVYAHFVNMLLAHDLWSKFIVPGLAFCINYYRMFFSVWKVFFGVFQLNFFALLCGKTWKTQLCVHVCGWYFIPFSPAPVQLFGGRSSESVNQDDKWSPIFQSASALLEQMVSINNQLCTVFLKCFVSIKYNYAILWASKKLIPVLVSIWHYVPCHKVCWFGSFAKIFHS